MEGYVEVLLRVPIKNDAEREAVLEFMFKGAAAEYIRMGAIYGLVPTGQGARGDSEPAVFASERKREEQSIVVERVATQLNPNIAPASERAEPARETKGPSAKLGGRRRKGRV